MYLAGAEVTEQAQATIVEAFEAQNPDIRVERLRVLSGFPDKVSALIATGNAPDVLNLANTYMMSFASELFLHDLTPLVQKTPDLQFSRLAPPLLEVFTVDGKLFAVPNTAAPSVYVFNADLFDRAGLSYPSDLYRQDAWTWAAFRDMAKKLTVKTFDGRYTVQGAAIHLPRTWLYSNGGKEFDDVKRPTQTFYNTDVALETVEFLHSMMWEDDAVAMIAGLSSRIGANQEMGMAQGKLGMGSVWFSTVTTLAEHLSTVGLVPYPKGPSDRGRYATDFGSYGTAITKQTADLDASWRLCAFIAGPEGAAVAASLPGRTPPRPVWITWLPDSVMNPEIYADLLVAGTNRLVSINQNQLQRVIDSQLKAVWDNTVDPKSALSEITRQINAFLALNPQ
jgi:multiple sugar transport system substrate-binding protein